MPPKSREFRKMYHPSIGRYVYVHRGNGLIVDNIMKPLKAAASAIGSKVGSTVAKAVGRKASKATNKAKEKAKSAVSSTAEKSGDLIRKRLSGDTLRGTRKKGPKGSKGATKMSQHEVNALINNLIAQS